MSVKILKEYEVSNQRIADVFVGAFEINPMFNSNFEVVKTNKPTNEDEVPDEYKGTFYSCLFNDGYVDIAEIDEYGEYEASDVMRLDYDSIKRGLQVMSQKLVRHFDDLVKGTGDAITSIEFLQCCLYPDYVMENGYTVFG